MVFNRDAFVEQLATQQGWDVVIIGGGATGLGTAVDAASRGYKTLLLEQSDFAKGTSSRSTKLVHGGVRYLAQGDIGLVYEALHERGLLLKNAAHLVKDQEFIIPVYSWFSKYKYLIGLKFYDLLAGKSGFTKSSLLSANEVMRAIPGLKPHGLMGGISYSDGQFDDARLALNLAQTAVAYGAVVLNYTQVTGLTKIGKDISGVSCIDLESGQSYHVNAKVVINATGVFVDEILKMDVPDGREIVRPSQGTHVVLDAVFLNGNSALMIPKTSDGRVLFAVPWHGRVLVGTTDTPLHEHRMEPKPLDQEIDFILNTASHYLTKKPGRADVLAVFAGLRPLAAPTKDTSSTKEISRSHKLMVSNSGLITITGGKWTTYRRMAMDVVDKAIELGKLVKKACITQDIRIHGYTAVMQTGNLALYGADAAGILLLIEKRPELNKLLHPDYEYVQAEVIWMVQQEMARTIEDVLSRRMRLLFLDAKAALMLAPAVARLMATALGKDEAWINDQINGFITLARQYLLYSPEAWARLIKQVKEIG
ncbi:glycerol-3-phosphate dehydrogenase/oxidase [Pedobacter sp. MC2016-24]|uniref:glycerol-3-phosphate dehydrogenase/oxidase n=1 Tax=Pedobacter sp. MC2016-24 TaxID=2780090 RepID=UPI0018814FB4|nr:glycerol-3-phosphate dehydrogenase/oxidase [Pedobacter sp. MC2016-24]MBE9599155.1 glycerol-3-phosphate dehydrogenase/oxidase [Pedobacter sp. MC2016-24]